MHSADIVETDIKATSWSTRILGQTNVWPKMLKAVQNERYPHCSLILGKPGQGQLVLALAIAQSLLCEKENKPCGQCSHCNKVKELIHPDLIFSFPLPGNSENCDEYSKDWRSALQEIPFMTIREWVERLDKEGKNANINVKEIRQFIDKVFLKPYEAKCKVAIVWMPEYLGKEGNRLLKLLEEPPAHSYIILVAEQAELILPTILSRAQIFHLQNLEIEEIKNYLVANHRMTEEAALTTASFCEGNIHEAILSSEESQIIGLELIKTLFQKAYQQDVIGMMAWLETFSSLTKEDQKNAINLFQQVLSFALRFKFEAVSKNSTQAIYLYSDKISQSLSVYAIEKIMEWTDDVYFALHRYGHVKMTLHSFVIKLANLLKPIKE